MKRMMIMVFVLSFIICGNVFALQVQSDCYYWNTIGWSNDTYLAGYLGNGYMTAYQPGEEEIKTTISGLAGNTDYNVWVRAYVFLGEMGALRSEIVDTTDPNEVLGRFVTHDTGYYSSGWYWQKAGKIHTPSGVTSIEYVIRQGFPVANWKSADEVLITDELSFEPGGSKIAGIGHIDIDGYDMAEWAPQQYNPPDFAPSIGMGNCAGWYPAPASYSLDCFEQQTEYYLWIRAGLWEDSNNRSLTSYVTDTSVNLGEFITHQGEFTAGELPDSNDWYWERAGSFTTSSETELYFYVSVTDLPGQDPNTYSKGIDELLITTDGDYIPPLGSIIATECGHPGTSYKDADVNKDCYVDFKDFSYIAEQWLKCNHPADSNCL